MDRWDGIERPYTDEDVQRLRGSVPVEHTLARLGAERLWELLAERDYVAALGAMTGGQAVEMVKAGLEAIYLSGWQVAADANLAAEVYPDQSSITGTDNVIATSQVALPKDTCDQVYAQLGYETSVRNLSRVSLDSDNVFRDDAGASQLGTVTGDVAGGLSVSLVVGVDTTTTPSGGGLGGPR